MKELIIKFFKFGVVGAVGTVVDFVVTALMMYIFDLGDYLSQSIDLIMSDGIDNVVLVVLFANTVGFVVAATSNYFFNRVWTFASKNPDVSNEYTRFFIVSLLGLGINLWVIYMFNTYAHLEFELFGIYVTNFWVAKTFATFVVMFWNFFANNYFTFRKAKVLEK